MMASDHPHSKSLHVAIVGGGITGLSAAWFLQESARSQGLSLSYTLLERSARWGGKIRTEEVGPFGDEPFVVEAGPDSFITQKPWALQLARRLGLEERLLPTNDERRKVFVLNDGKPTPLPDGVLLIVPTEFKPFALSPLISPLGKLRMAMDLFIPPRKDREDETLAEFITRRLGSEALDKIAEPLMSGIYNAEAEQQSLLATFPRFRAIEEKHGSLIRGMLAARRARNARPQPSANGQKAPSTFVSFQNGMAELVEELQFRLEGDCRLETAVEDITWRDGGYALSLSDGNHLQSDAVILAVPAYVAAGLLENVAPQAAGQLGQIRYVSTGTVSVGFRADEVDHPLDGFGLVIPRSEGRPLNALTWTSTKFDHRSPQEYVLLRAFFGGSRRPEMMGVSDAELVSILRSELQDLLGITAEPVFHRIYRWFNANPQYDVGHLQRVEAIENALPAGIYVTGSPYRGIGIPDCVHQAQQTVEMIVQEALAQPA